MFVSCNAKVFYLREEFLSNTGNKEQLVQILSKNLLIGSHTVISCNGDADTQIVDSALEVICKNKVATVVIEDTDVLAMLIYFWNSKIADVFFRTESRKYQPVKIQNVRTIVESLHSAFVKNILFVHACNGCYSTSATYNHGRMLS